MIEPGSYRPPFVTETDEARWDDCGPCSFLMLAATWTLGEVLHRPNGDHWNLKRLRERLRNHLPADRQAGYTDMGDARAYLKAEWPFLDLPLSRGDWWGILADLRSGEYAAVAQGNPSGAPADSPLRRWTGNDDFGHFIYLDRADPDRGIFVMDPLGRGDYRGQWVPTSHVRDYAKDGVVSVVLVPRGGETAEARTRRRMARKLSEAEAEHAAEVRTLNARITDLEAQLLPVTEAAATARREENAAVIDAVVAYAGGLRLP